MSYIFKLFIFMNVVIHFLLAEYNCASPNFISLQSDEIAFYNLQFMDDGSCAMTFELAENNNATNVRCFTVYKVMGYDTSEIINHFDISYASNYSILDDQSTSSTKRIGFILFDDWNDNCPLESISRVTPFKFDDETQILYIRSSYEENFNRTHPCLWKFTAPTGYGFKVVIEILDISSSAYLTIENTTDIIANEKSAKLLHPYYNSDIHIQIYLTRGDHSFITQMEFQAYISIVKNKWIEVDGKCTTQGDDDTGITWGNMDNAFNSFDTYPNNAKCSYDLLIRSKTEISVAISLFYLENNIDYIQYYDEIFGPIKINNETDLVFAPYKNGSERIVKWEFVSDGSVPSWGFGILFDTHFCKCASEDIYPSENKNTIMDDFEGYYCGGLKCNFTLKPPNDNSSLMYFKIFPSYNSNDNEAFFDVFRVISNDFIVMEVNSANRQNLFAYLNPSNNNIFQVISHSSKSYKNLFFTYDSTKKPPMNKKYILSSSTPSYLVDMGAIENSLIQVETVKDLITENISIEVYSNLAIALDRINIYNNESLTFIMTHGCFIPGTIVAYSCVIPNSSFVIYPSNYIFLVIKLSANFGGCVFGNNIFLTNALSKFSISEIAKENEACFIHVLVDELSVYAITKLWTTSKIQKVKVYIGTDLSQLYFEFNSNSQNNLTDITMFSKVYTIQIPKNSSILFYLIKFPKPNFLPSYEISNLPCPYRSVLATPFFKTSKKVITYSWVQYNLDDYTIKFTVMEIYNYTLMNFQDANEINTTVKEVGQTFTYKNGEVTLNSDYRNCLDYTCGAIFYVEIISECKKKHPS